MTETLSSHLIGFIDINNPFRKKYEATYNIEFEKIRKFLAKLIKFALKNGLIS